MIAEKIAPQNSLILIKGSSLVEIPAVMSGQLVTATPSCIAVGTLSAADGETSITLTDKEPSTGADSGLHIAFKGRLVTPNHEVYVSSVLNETILRITTKDKTSQVQVWANDDNEPSKLIIVIN